MSGASQGLWRVTHSVGQAEVGDRQWVIPGDSCKDRRALPGGHSGGRDTSAVAGSGDRDWGQRLCEEGRGVRDKDRGRAL